MFDFLQKKEDEEVEEVVEQVETHNITLEDIYEQLEYLNSYISQSNMIQGELLKQQTIANALSLLDQQYRHADGFMSVEEIQNKYHNLACEIFLDYQQENLNNLENRD